MRLITGKILFIIFIVTASFFPIESSAQQNLEKGDVVEVDVIMSSDATRASWKKATVTKVEMWNGKVTGYTVKTADGLELTYPLQYIRKVTNTTNNPINNNNTTNTIGNNTLTTMQFKVGDRVEVDKVMANDSNGAR